MSRSQRNSAGYRLVTTLVASCLFAMTFAAQAQNLVSNGDFENNTASAGGSFNLSNSVFMSTMPNTIALGTAGELDIFNSGAEDSNWSVGFAIDYRQTPPLSDVLAVELNGPLVVGNT